VLAILAVVAAIALPSQQPEPSLAYWERKRGCERGYADSEARRVLRYLLHRRRPLRAAQLRRVRDRRVCALDREGRLARELLVRQLRHWRLEYRQVWVIRFYRLAPWLRAWAWRTGACESGNDPTASTGNGFYGAFQWVPSTWYAAGGDRWPTRASWHHQAVLAVRWMLKAGDEQWPVCGD
jgi:Transglycosylase-like domain